MRSLFNREITLPSPDIESAIRRIDREDIRQALVALSPYAARRILVAIRKEPATITQLSDRLGLSQENIGFHIENLEYAGLIEIVDSHGRYQDPVFRTTDHPLVFFLPIDNNTLTLNHVFILSVFGAAAAFFVRTALQGDHLTAAATQLAGTVPLASRLLGTLGTASSSAGALWFLIGIFFAAIIVLLMGERY